MSKLSIMTHQEAIDKVLNVLKTSKNTPSIICDADGIEESLTYKIGCDSTDIYLYVSTNDERNKYMYFICPKTTLQRAKIVEDNESEVTKAIDSAIIQESHNYDEMYIIEVI